MVIHKDGGLLYATVAGDAVSLDYPSPDGFDVLSGTFTVQQSDQGGVHSNDGVVRLEGATAASTVPGEATIAPVGLTPSIGETLGLAGPVVDPRLATVVPSIQWFADGSPVGTGGARLLSGGTASWCLRWLGSSVPRRPR